MPEGEVKTRRGRTPAEPRQKGWPAAGAREASLAVVALVGVTFAGEMIGT